MNKHSSANPFLGCSLYALATLPLTALAVVGGVWLERLGVWATLWPDSINAWCCFVPCLGVALPLGLLGYYLPLRRGAFWHHLAQMTDNRGLALLDFCLLIGATAVGLAGLFLLPASNPGVYVPAVLVLVAVALRWTVRNLIVIVPFDEDGHSPDLAALGQHSRMSADDLSDYNFPPPTIRITFAGSTGMLGQMQVGPWRVEIWSVASLPGKDSTRQIVRLVGTLTNISSAPGSVEHLPRWGLRDARGQEVAPQQVVTSPIGAKDGSRLVVPPGASASLTLAFDAGAMERTFDLLARSRELSPGEEVVMPF